MSILSSLQATLQNLERWFGITLPPAEDIYDAIMGPIEPELLSVNIPKLQAYYQGELPDEHTKRMVRYQQAYALYQERYNEWITQVRKLMQQMQKQAMKTAEAKTLELERQALDAFDAQFDAVA